MDGSADGRTAAEWQRALGALFRAAGADSPALDARLLIQAACGLSAEEIIARPDYRPDPAQTALLADYAARRERGEPVSRILGIREFWGREFTVTPDTLDPRPDTETLVEAALGWVRAQGRLGEPLRLLDLGTGTGCILIALLGELPQARGAAVDVSAGALDAARVNAARHGMLDRIDFYQGSWFEPLGAGESFDLIVSNPPYIAESDMEGLACEVRNHDPRGALTDENDGFGAYKTIYPQLAARLAAGGMGFFEIGAGQAERMRRLVEESKATLYNVYKDLAGRERVFALCAPNKTGKNQKS